MFRGGFLEEAWGSPRMVRLHCGVAQAVDVGSMTGQVCRWEYAHLLPQGAAPGWPGDWTLPGEERVQSSLRGAAGAGLREAGPGTTRDSAVCPEGAQDAALRADLEGRRRGPGGRPGRGLGAGQL